MLDAAFRSGYSLAHGCREGQCSACKCFLLQGSADLERYSNYALSDTERANGYTLMCRARPESDLVIELLHFDPENYRLENAIRDVEATVTEVRELTHDIVGLNSRSRRTSAGDPASTSTWPCPAPRASSARSRSPACPTRTRSS